MGCGLQDAQAYQDTFDLFLIFDAVVNLLLEVREPLDLDLLVPLIFQLFTCFLHQLLLFGDFLLQLIMSYLKLTGSRHLFKYFCEFLRGLVPKAEHLELILI